LGNLGISVAGFRKSNYGAKLENRVALIGRFLQMGVNAQEAGRRHTMFSMAAAFETSDGFGFKVSCLASVDDASRR